jgi:hypothetical protein
MAKLPIEPAIAAPAVGMEEVGAGVETLPLLWVGAAVEVVKLVTVAGLLSVG